MKRIMVMAALLCGCSGDGPGWFMGDTETTDTDTETDTALDSGVDAGDGGDGDTDTESETVDTDTVDTESETEDTETATETEDTETEDTETEDTDSETEDTETEDTETEDTDTTTACPAGVASLDAATNICWQIGYGGPVTLEAAVLYCDTLTLGGYDDWVLANRGDYVAMLGGCDVSVLSGGVGYCSGCLSSPKCVELLNDAGTIACYWTSTAYDTTQSWGVCLNNGLFDVGPNASSGGLARCVRSDP